MSFPLLFTSFQVPYRNANESVVHRLHNMCVWCLTWTTYRHT
jgi:hypothetical protein